MLPFVGNEEVSEVTNRAQRPWKVHVVSKTNRLPILQVLSDDEKRSIYDRFGEAGLKGQGAGGPGVSYDLYTLSRV